MSKKRPRPRRFKTTLTKWFKLFKLARQTRNKLLRTLTSNKCSRYRSSRPKLKILKMLRRITLISSSPEISNNKNSKLYMKTNRNYMKKLWTSRTKLLKLEVRPKRKLLHSSIWRRRSNSLVTKFKSLTHSLRNWRVKRVNHLVSSWSWPKNYRILKSSTVTSKLNSKKKKMITAKQQPISNSSLNKHLKSILSQK